MDEKQMAIALNEADKILLEQHKILMETSTIPSDQTMVLHWRKRMSEAIMKGEPELIVESLKKHLRRSEEKQLHDEAYLEEVNNALGKQL